MMETHRVSESFMARGLIIGDLGRTKDPNRCLAICQLCSLEQVYQVIDLALLLKLVSTDQQYQCHLGTSNINVPTLYSQIRICILTDYRVIPMHIKG